jgi:calcium binding protein 39
VLDNFLLLPFEARKDAAQIFNNLVHKNIADFVQYICANIHIVDMLIDGYNQPDIALNGGAMLRECVRYDDLARAILYSDKFWV